MKNKIYIITKNDKEYPESLKYITNPPEKLYVKGNVDLLKQKILAIVGSRKCTEYGGIIAKQMACELGEFGITIVSGLACGIDTEAHLGATNSKGNTIAVLGSGIDNIFPEENIELAKQIVNSGGLIVSEYEPNEKWQSKYFPIRNRIVSGLSIRSVDNRSRIQEWSKFDSNYSKKTK